MRATVDLNCDMGESFGAWRMGDDEAMLEVVTSANVACGYHGGDPRVIDATIRAAVRRGVAVGAHPSYPDLAGFGRRSMDVAPADLERMLIYQIGAVAALAAAAGARLGHVKPHGALYNDAARDPQLSAAIARAVAAIDSSLILVGLSGSALVAAGHAIGLQTAEEAFCDRAYESDGTLRSRNRSGSVHSDPQTAARQAVEIVLHQRARSYGGEEIAVNAQTLCIHGDTSGAVEIAKAVRAALEREAVIVAPLQSTRRAGGRAGSGAP